MRTADTLLILRRLSPLNLVVDRSSKNSGPLDIPSCDFALDLTHDPFAFSLLSLRHPSIQLSPRQFSAQPTFHQPRHLSVSQKQNLSCLSFKRKLLCIQGKILG